MKLHIALSAAALFASGAAATLVDDILVTVSALPECAQKAFHDVYATPSDICADLSDLAADTLASDANIRSMVGKCQSSCSKDDFKILEDDENAILGAIASSCQREPSYGSYSTTKDTTTPAYGTPTPVYTTKPRDTTTPADTTPVYTKPTYTKPVYSTPAYSKPAYSTPAYSKPAYTTPARTTPAYTKPAFTELAHTKPAYTKPASTPSYAAGSVYSPKPTPTYYEPEPTEHGYGYDEPESTDHWYGYEGPEPTEPYGSYSGSYDGREVCSGVDYRCPTEGGSEFLQCDNGKWVVQVCAQGTVCIQDLFTRMHVSPCGFPAEY